MTRLLTACCLALLTAAVARAQDEDFRPVQLVLHPAAAPSPALKYRLLPELRDQKPEDAGPLYRKVVELLMKSWQDVPDGWEDGPPGELPRAKVRTFLDQFKEELALLDRAALGERCDWGLAERIRKSGIATLLPELQPLRNGARLLAVRARLEIADGRPDDAVRTIRTGFVLGHHLGESPTLICCLVGNAITAVMAKQLEELIQREKAANLYWALTDLPRPFLDMHTPLAGERLGLYGTFPGLLESVTDPGAPPMTEEQVKKSVKVIVDNMAEVVGFKSRAALGLAVRARHEASRKAQVAQGWPRAAVDRMPHVQVALLHAAADYDRLFDEYVKWETFPYAEARPRLEESLRRLKEGSVLGTGPALPLARLLLPAIDKVLAARARLDRTLAALRCVEAIRLYAAAHGGKLPTRLLDIKEVPVPTDPMTGKPFRYRAEGDTALLEGPPPAGQKQGLHNAIAYQVTLRR